MNVELGKTAAAPVVLLVIFIVSRVESFSHDPVS